MPMPRMNLVGHRFTRLKVIEFAGLDQNKQSLFQCVCDCGNEIVVKGSLLKRKNTQSCGCLRVEKGRDTGLKAKLHGMISTPTYKSWQSMKARCYQKTHFAYRWYGAKGVTICDKWQTFAGFFDDMGERPNGMTLDRINPFGNYELLNCRWADRSTQSRNTRKNYVGELCQ